MMICDRIYHNNKEKQKTDRQIEVDRYLIKGGEKERKTRCVEGDRNNKKKTTGKT